MRNLGRPSRSDFVQDALCRIRHNASASISRTFLPCCARLTPRLTAVVVLPTPPFWFVRAITLQFDIGASSFRINLATLSRWLCKGFMTIKKADWLFLNYTNRLCKSLFCFYLLLYDKAFLILSVSHFSGNNTAII